MHERITTTARTLDARSRSARARLVIPKEKIVELIEAHATLEEPTPGAIQIWPDAGEAWLADVIPSMADDDKADEPTQIAPTPSAPTRCRARSNRRRGTAASGGLDNADNGRRGGKLPLSSSPHRWRRRRAARLENSGLGRLSAIRLRSR